MTDVSEIMKELVANGRASDLLEILMGMSKFNLPSSSKEPMTDEGQRQWQMALLHFRFINEYGLGASEVNNKGKQYFAYPKEFDQWLDSGHSGIEKQEIIDYLRAKSMYRAVPNNALAATRDASGVLRTLYTRP